jgi:hypothetical protein
MGASAAIVFPFVNPAGTMKAATGAVLPKPPGALVMMQPPGVSGSSADANDANSAAARARRKVAAGEGQSDTNLTGPRGLGEIGGQNLQIKTLLGY